MVRFCLVVWAVLLVGKTRTPLQLAASPAATSQRNADLADGGKSPPRELRLLTYNVCRGRRNLEKIAAFVGAEKADIVFLQEVSRGNAARGVSSQADQIAALLGGYAVMDAETLSLPTSQSCDTAILAKFPLRKGGVCVLREGEHAFGVYAKLQFGEHRLHLISVHLKSTFRLDSDHLLDTANLRLAQTQALIEYVRRIEGDLVVAGDFNAVAWMPEYHDLTQVLTDLGATLKQTEPTFPSWRPAARIDYIFARGGVRAKSYQVRNARWSDHKPVNAVIEWRPAARPGIATSQPVEGNPASSRGKKRIETDLKSEGVRIRKGTDAGDRRCARSSVQQDGNGIHQVSDVPAGHPHRDGEQREAEHDEACPHGGRKL